MPKPTAEEIYRVLVSSRQRKAFTIQDTQELYSRGITNLEMWSRAIDVMDYLEPKPKRK